MPEAHDIDTLLKARRFEKTTPDFAERIIHASRFTRQVPQVSLLGWLREAFAEAMLPRPAFAVMTVLVLGVAIGFSSPILSVGSEEDATIQTYFSDNGTTL